MRREPVTRADPRTRLADICLALPEAQAGADQHDVDWAEIAEFVRVSYRLIAPRRLAALAR